MIIDTKRLAAILVHAGVAIVLLAAAALVIASQGAA